MWQGHSHQLSRIITIRWQTNGTEKHPFIVWIIWMTCIVDTYALLSSSGTGSFFENVLKLDILPPPKDTLAPLTPGQISIFFPEEASHFPDLLELNQKIIIVSHRIGLVARDLRLETKQRRQADPNQVISEHLYIQLRQKRLQKVENYLRTERESWRQRFPDYQKWLKIGEWENNFFLAPRVLAVCEHAYTLLRAVIIYMHTSMYPSQIVLPEVLPEVASCVSDILVAAQRIIASNRLELRYIVFPLFIAGYATRSEEQKKLSLEFLEKMDEDSLGGNTNEVRKLLEIIHQLQRETNEVVDWVQEMKKRGLSLVIFGF